MSKNYNFSTFLLVLLKILEVKVHRSLTKINGILILIYLSTVILNLYEKYNMIGRLFDYLKETFVAFVPGLPFGRFHGQIPQIWP